MDIKRVGIMTGGGDCPGLNPVIRAAVKTGVQKHGWEIFGIEDAFMGLIDLDYRSPHGNLWLDEKTVDDILTKGGTILGTSNRSHPFKFAVERNGEVVETDVSDKVMENYKKMELDALISIGGDGSMEIAQEFVEKGMNIVGVPKTIDNDLSATDVTFGFDTAVGVATDALDRIRDTAESHDRVMLVEVMGRNAGWIALYAGLAGGAHSILIPEIPYSPNPVARLVEKRRKNGYPFSVIVVAEGAKPAGGDVSALPKLPGGMPRLFGAAAKVTEGLSSLIESDMRITVLGHIQRGGSPSNYDRLLATRFGHMAAKLVAEKDFGKMVALRGTEIVSVPITEAIGKPNRVDPKGQLISTARDLGIVFGDE